MKKIYLLAGLLLCFVCLAGAKDIPDWKLGVSVGITTDQETLNAIKAASFSFLEISGFGKGTREETIALVAGFKERADKAGLKIWSVHIPFNKGTDLSGLDPGEYEICVRNIFDFMDMTRGLGKYEKAVLHPSFGPIPDEEREERLKSVKHRVGGLAKQIKKEYGVAIALECLPRTGLGNTSGEITDILRNAPDMEICFDSNHLFKENPEEFVRKVGSHITTVHISDYDGINEKHWIPGKGVIDWKAVLQALADIGYDGPFLYECVGAVKDYEGRMADFYKEQADFFHNTRKECNLRQ